MSNNGFCDEFDKLNVEKLPQVVLHTIANELPNHWKKLARQLGISDQEIKNLVKSSEFTTAYEQTYQMLNSWIKQNPQKTWRDIKDELVFCEQINVLDKCERNLSVQSVFGVQPPSANFFSRGKELNEIHCYLFDLKDLKKPLVLCGMSGVGKTQIARKYCEKYQKNFTNIIWIDAAFGKLQNSMITVCQKLGLIASDTKDNSFDIDVIIQKVHNYFKNEQTLYIFDSVDKESVINLVTYVSRNPNSFTLITSQWRTWSDNANNMSIDVFSHEEAINYLKVYIKTDRYKQLEELIKELNCHPFAITQAIKYINANSVSIQTYIERYRAHPIEILYCLKFSTEEESMSAVKAINLVLTNLEYNKEIITLKILNCLSHCDGQNISKHFIVQISKHMKINDDSLVDEAIRFLVSNSLLDCIGDNKYSMQELTQLSCHHFQSKNSSTKMFHVLIEDYFRFELKDIKHHVDYGSHFVYHFLYFFKNNKKKMAEAFHLASITLYDFLTFKGLFQEVIEILKAIQAFNAEIYGENDEQTLNTKFNIGRCLNAMGKYNEALEIYYSIDKIRTEILGINHPSTINIKNNIAICLNEMGKYKEALEIYYSVDKIQTETLGINHKSTMNTKNNIAICLNKMGKYKEALEIHYSVDKIQTETLGINHMSTMNTKNNIAICLYDMGKYKEALEIYYSVDKIKTEILGINHPSTMGTKNNIANCLNKIGKYNEALEVFYYVDKIQTDVLGIYHPSTMNTKNNIAIGLYDMGKYKEALEIYYSVDEIKTEILGINHPSTLDTKKNIAICLCKMGIYKKALEIYYSVDKIQTKILGINHPSTMATKNNIAGCLNLMGKHNEALEILSSVNKIQIEVLGINHPSTMDTQNNIANCFYEMGKYKEALETHYFVDKIKTEILGINHPSTMETKNNIASCYYKMGKYKKALKIYYSIIKTQTETINHPSTKNTKHNIAICHRLNSE